jgi:hypothetical protein
MSLVKFSIDPRCARGDHRRFEQTTITSNSNLFAMA